jgi:predicted RecA/RadA family phage recombinase
MENYEQRGEVQTSTPPVGGVTSGQPYQIGQKFGIATKTVSAAEALAGATAELLIRGVVTVTKAGTQAWTEGALVYWDDGAREFTTVAAGNLLVGWAVLPEIGAGVTETTGHVYLDGVARDNEAS